MIDPSYVYRPFEEELFNTLDESTDRRDKPEVIEGGKVMKIPFTVRNRKLLIEHTNPGKKIFGPLMSEALAQCNDAPEKTGFCVVKEEEVYPNETYSDQQALIEGKKGYKLVLFRVGFVFYTIMYCKTGSCPVTAGPKVRYARTANTVQVQLRGTSPISIGGHRNFIHVGRVVYDDGSPDTDLGALAGFSAEV